MAFDLIPKTEMHAGMWFDAGQSKLTRGMSNVGIPRTTTVPEFDGLPEDLRHIAVLGSRLLDMKTDAAKLRAAGRAHELGAHVVSNAKRAGQSNSQIWSLALQFGILFPSSPGEIQTYGGEFVEAVPHYEGMAKAADELADTMQGMIDDSYSMLSKV